MITIFAAEVVECAVCQGAVKSLDTLLKNKKVDDEIEVLLEKSCNSIPAQYNERVSFYLFDVLL